MRVSSVNNDVTSLLFINQSDHHLRGLQLEQIKYHVSLLRQHLRTSTNSFVFGNLLMKWHPRNKSMYQEQLYLLSLNRLQRTLSCMCSQPPVKLNVWALLAGLN